MSPSTQDVQASTSAVKKVSKLEGIKERSDFLREPVAMELKNDTNHFSPDGVQILPVTLQIPEHAGIEPDHCFWLRNWAAVNGKSRIDLATDPPPDIAVEVDVTNFTNIDDDQPFKVAEVWLIRRKTLAIFVLTSEGYIQADSSQFFPDVAMPTLYRQVIAAIADGASPPRAIRSAL